MSASIDYQAIRYDYRRSHDQDCASPQRHPVVIVGAGPVGLALAIDLAQQQIPVVVLDNDNKLSHGSRAICFAKRTLEIFDRLGCGQRMLQKGISWNVGRVFFKNDPVWQFNLLPQPDHAFPAFINLQQYYVEGYLVERCAELDLIDLRWLHTVEALQTHDDHVVLDVRTPDGPYSLEADWLIACDGSRSVTRRLMGLESKGQVFQDRFLIADIRMTADFPTERWFWFDPPFHPKQSVLLHRQPDDVWRVDFQLGWDADPEVEKQPERIRPRIQALLGEDTGFEIVWASVYTFACQRMECFRHGRVVFAGDSAHGVSPFGARGANSGVQDADNLAWKLAHVLKGQATEGLIDSYAHEREFAADDNIRNSTRATDFITPKSEISRLFRDSVLELAREHPFARPLINSGRLSTPTVLSSSPLNTPDDAEWTLGPCPGSPALDAPLGTRWLLQLLHGSRFCLLVVGEPPGALDGLNPDVSVLRVDAHQDTRRVVASRYGQHVAYLLRPDQHVAARWYRLDVNAIHAAHRRALALEPVACP